MVFRTNCTTCPATNLGLLIFLIIARVTAFSISIYYQAVIAKTHLLCCLRRLQSLNNRIRVSFLDFALVRFFLLFFLALRLLKSTFLFFLAPLRIIISFPSQFTPRRRSESLEFYLGFLATQKGSHFRETRSLRLAFLAGF